MPKLTLFTPSYNRAHTLPRLFESLCRQTSKEFEWILIDDGSSDETESLAQKFQQTAAGFPMIFLRTENGGKHRAINRAVEMARGEFFFIVDSDDYLTNNAVELVHTWLLEIGECFAGVSGRKIKSRTAHGGGPLPAFGGQAYIDMTNQERNARGLTQDMAEVYRTSLLRRFPFPELEGETFIPESIVWDAIASEGHPLRWYDQPIYRFETQDGGLSRSWNELLLRNPRGYGLLVNREMQWQRMNLRFRMSERSHYYRQMRERYTFWEICGFLQIQAPTLFFALALTFPRVVAQRTFSKILKK
ncbi:MAG: glycosyltransferase family 2 protein [Oscillospiraceae bacterium]|jgi:glycosyltransferase involved in cell wall biosynthesis|nr:glycosyltransferase family 2 protein [Oscillospiraceae bacterium]